MVVVTHEMGFAREVGNRVLFMDLSQDLRAGQPGGHIFASPGAPPAGLPERVL